MSLLEEHLDLLKSDLAARPLRIAAHSDMPFAIFRCSPAEEFALRKQLRLFAIDLEQHCGRRVTFISPRTEGERVVLAERWIDYALGIVLGRFAPGVEGAIGKLGEVGAREVAEAIGGTDTAEEKIRAWLQKGLWKHHFTRYRKRPVYWPIQSPKKRYTVWIFHGKLTSDILFHIRNEIVENRLRLAEREIQDVTARSAQDKRLLKLKDGILDLTDDLREFSARLKTLAEGDYAPHIDDGVLLNAAPLHVDHWPDRVREACATNRSFAIAHGLDDGREGTEDSPSKKRGRRRKSAGQGSLP
jgi:hypothetical protein